MVLRLGEAHSSRKGRDEWGTRLSRYATFSSTEMLHLLFEPKRVYPSDFLIDFIRRVANEVHLPEMITCGNCRQIIPSNDFRQHFGICKRHPRMDRRHEAKPLARPALKSRSDREDIGGESAIDRAFAEKSGKFHCLDCWDWLEQEERFRHSQMHNYKSALAGYPNISASSWRGCLHCVSVFLLREMESHLLSFHPRVKVSDRNIQGRMMQPAPRREPMEPEPSTIPVWKEIRRPDPAADLKRSLEQKQNVSLDATVRFAHANRESGKFGSHAAYDGCDEESKL